MNAYVTHTVSVKQTIISSQLWKAEKHITFYRQCICYISLDLCLTTDVTCAP